MLSTARPRQAIMTFLTPGPRMIDEIECAVSVMLAVLFAHLIGATMVSWAAFTSFVLMRGHISETLLRAMMRIVGTLVGAALALLLVPYVARSWPAASIAAGAIGAVALYGTLTAKRAYAWLLFGLTFEMILFDKLENPALDTLAFAKTRLLEIGAGTAACLIVSLLTTLTARRRWPGRSAPPQEGVGWHSHAARHALQGGVALALVPIVHTVVGLHALQQAGVTIMAVMIVPVAALSQSGMVPVTRKLLHRVIGCLCGGALAAAILFVAAGHAPVLIAGTCLGVLIGRHIENGGGRFTYVGMQFTLAVLVTLIPDSFSSAAIRPGLVRLESIVCGMALLEPVLLVWYFATWRHGRSHLAMPDADNWL